MRPWAVLAFAHSGWHRWLQGVTVATRLGMLPKKSKKQIPRGLKSARNDKNKRLRRGPEGPLYPIKDFFRNI
jgi:hypothetical protein